MNKNLLLLISLGLVIICFFINQVLGFIAALIFIFLILPMKLKEVRKHRLTKLYGKEMADKIINKKPEIGMTLEIISQMYQDGQKGKEKVTKNETVVRYYFDSYTQNNKTKFRKYFIFSNNILIEFGDL